MQKREKTTVKINRTMLINNIINNRVNAYFPKVEASTNQVETQKRPRISQTSNQQQQSRNEKN